MSEIDRPIFLIGTGRSGTTLSLNLLSLHPDLAWYSNLTHRFPARPQLAAYSRVRDIPFLKDIFARRNDYPHPVESYAILDYATLGVFTEPRLLSARDVSQEARHRYQALVRSHLRWQGKSRFLQKTTGFPRIAYLNEIFPDSKFIHVIRDGREVAASMLRVDWWDGTLDSWGWGDMDPSYLLEYEESGRAPIVLAAIVWKTLMGHLTRATRSLPTDRTMDLPYDRLLSDPRGTMERVREFAGLRPSRVFAARVEEVPIRETRDKWRTLDSRSQGLLEDSLREDLVHYGFIDQEIPGRPQKS